MAILQEFVQAPSGAGWKVSAYYQTESFTGNSDNWKWATEFDLTLEFNAATSEEAANSVRKILEGKKSKPNPQFPKDKEMRLREYFVDRGGKRGNNQAAGSRL